MKIIRLCVCGLLACISASVVFGQAVSRPRIVQLPESSSPQQPQKPTVKPLIIQRISIPENPNPSSFVKKTVDTKPNFVLAKSESSANAVLTNLIKSSLYDNQVTSTLFYAIQSKLGIPYRYGSEGPNSYDCSGFVWSVFQAAGFHFERTSARSLWQMSEPVSENEKYKFGTLVFFNRLGHVGIVVDEKGFYHASRNKGITYSPFAGYWEKRIVGFRKLSLKNQVEILNNLSQTKTETTKTKTETTNSAGSTDSQAQH